MTHPGSTDGLRLSERARLVRPSPALGLLARAQALAAQGRSVLSFGAGEPDFPPPDHVRRATARALARGVTRYTPSAGTADLREEIARQLRARTGASLTAANVIVTPGAKMALFELFQSTCGPGDEVVLFAPCWPSYLDLVRLSGADPVVVQTRASDGHRPDPAKLREALTTRTRIVLLNSPGNPTGACYDRATLESLAQVIEPSRALIVSDEIYGRLTFPGSSSPSIASLSPAWAARTVIVDGVSKAYAMTGFRIGWAAGPVPLIAAMTRIQEQTVSCPTSFAQAGALAALQGPQESVEAMVRELERRRDFIVAGLDRVEGVSCQAPDGAFYVLPDITGVLGRRAGERVLSTSVDLCEWLIDEHGLALLPGEPFGAPGHLRWSFAASMDELQRGLARFREAIASLG